MPSEKILKGRFLIKPSKEGHLYPGILSSLVTGVLLGAIALLPVSNTFGYTLIKALQLMLFFVFGNMQVLPGQIFLKPYPGPKPGSHILLITISLCVLLSAFYIFLKKDVWLIAFSSSAAFILPYYLRLCWQFFISIPVKEFNTWFPETVLPGKAVVSLDSLVVRLKILQHVSDKDEKIYTVFIPNGNKLGNFFSRFLAEHNMHELSFIETNDMHENKYAWEFFEVIFFGLGSRKINPFLTMAENKIKKDAIVRIKRLKQQQALTFKNKTLFNETIK